MTTNLKKCVSAINASTAEIRNYFLWITRHQRVTTKFSDRKSPVLMYYYDHERAVVHSCDPSYLDLYWRSVNSTLRHHDSAIRTAMHVPVSGYGFTWESWYSRYSAMTLTFSSIQVIV